MPTPEGQLTGLGAAATKNGSYGLRRGLQPLKIIRLIHLFRVNLYFIPHL